MKFLNIMSKSTYQKDGQEKAAWKQVGVLKITDGGKQFIDLFMFPNQTYYVFEPKPKEAVEEFGG